MGKKLLSVFFLLSIFFLISFSGFGQDCTGASVNITSSDADNTICAGESVTFTANATNAGNNPKFQWRVNGVNQGSNGTSSSFTPTNLQNGHVVSLVLTPDCEGAPPINSNNTIAIQVNAVPTAPSITGDNSVCAGDSISLTANNITGATYTWTGPHNFTSTGKDLTRTGVTNSMAGTYTVTVTVNGCTSSAGSINVAVNPIPGTPTAGNGGAVCPGGTINLTAGNITGATYSWSGPGGFTSSAQNPSRTGATTAMAGVYTVTATINECTSTAATTTVAVNSAPTAPTAGNAGAVCVGGTINLTASNISGATYAWTGPGSWTSNVQNPSRSGATTAMGGTYSVIAIVNGCPSTSATTNVTVNTIPAAPTAGNGGAVCVGGTITLTTPTVTGATYSWTGPNNFTSSSQNPSIPNTTTAMAGAYNITVTVNGCTSAAGTTNVVVNTIPTVTATTPGERCGSGTVTLGATASSGIVNWYSAASGGSVLGTGTSFTTPSISSTTSYYVDATANGCTTGTRTEVIATVKNIPTITATTPGNVCTTGPVTLSATASAGTINWYTSATGGTSLHTGATYTTPSISTTTTYYVDATLNGCTTSSRTPVEAKVTTVPTITSTTPGSRCDNGPVTLSATASAGTVTWYSSNTSNTPLATGNNYSPSITATTTYYVAAVLNGCASARTAITATRFSGSPTNGPGNSGATKITAGFSGSICPGPSATGFIFNAPTGMANVQTYNWSLPPGFNITSGAGTNTITVSVPGPGAINANNQNVTVTAVNPCGSVTSDAFKVNVANFAGVNAGPDISMCLNSSITLTNTPSGNTNNITWSFVSGTGTIIGGPYPAPFTFQPTSAGSVTLRATTNTASGNCTTAAGTDDVIITVNQPPAITTQPVATQTLCSGSSTNLSVEATGTGLTYQWRKDGNNINGATSASLTLNNVATSNSGIYSVVVSGLSPCSLVTSANSELIVNEVVAITAQPVASQTICSGTTANFSVTATGTGLSYQWKKDGVDIANATSSTFAITNTTSSDSGNYSVVVSGTSPCSAVTSSVSTLTVNDVVQITTQPAATQTLCAGSEATFGVVASGTGLTYQWKKNGTNISNATSSTYTIGNTSSNDTGNYTVVVSGAAPCSAITSSVASLTVNTPSVAPTSLSASVSSICNGANTSVTLSQTGGSLGTGAVWKWYSDATYTTIVSGTVTAQGGLAVSPTATTTYYLRAENTADPCTSIVSGPSAGVTVTVNEPSIAPTALTASSPEICNGDNTSVTLTPTGGSLGTNAVWKWYTNSNYTTPVNGTVGTDGIITVTPTVTTTYYLRAEGNTVPCTANVNGPSSGVTVTVNEPVVITTDLDDSATVSVCAGFPFEFEIQATGTNLTYQWQLNGQNITGANSAKLSVSQAATSNAGTYQVIVNGTESCSQQVSKSVELIVNQSITISSQPAPTSTVCEDGQFSLSVVAGGNISSYLWRKNGIPISEGNGISGTETATLNFNSISVADYGSYDVVISSPAESCSQIISTPAEINVNNKSENPTGISASSEAVCAGDSTVLTLQGGGNGTNEEIKWYTDNQGNNLIGTGNGIAVSPTVTTTYYGRYETPAPCSYNSEWVEIAITVNDASTITLDTAEATTGQTICINSPLTPIVYSIGGGGLSASITAGQLPAGVTGDFTDGKFTISGTPTESGSEPFSYTITTEGPCEEQSLSGTITVNPAPVVTIAAEHQEIEICFDGTAYNITAGATVTNAASFLWSVPTGSGTINNPSSLTEATYTPSSGVNSPVTLTLTAVGLTGCSESIATKKIFVNQKPTAPGVVNVAYCHNSGNAPALTASADTGATLNWYDSASSTTALTAAPVPNTATVTTTPISYWVSQTSASGCESERAEIKITIYALPVVTAQVTQNVICLGSPALLSATGGVSYIWYEGANVIGNQASISHTPTAAGDYIYKVEVTDANGCKNTADVNVKVDLVTVAGTLTAPASVCINNASGQLVLAGFTGSIVKWESKAANATTWSVFNSGNTASTQNFSNLTQTTSFRATVKSGVCSEATVEKTVTIDPLPVGGKLAFDIVTASNDGRIFTICQGANSGYKDINLTGSSGTIYEWEYSINGAPFVPLAGETTSVLAASKIQSLDLSATTVFRVEIKSGSCTPNVYSQTAILSVIENDIAPKPVTVSKPVICLGEEVTLSSETGYSSATPIVQGGAFDNAGIKNHGWRFTRPNGTEFNFETNANNVNPDVWSRATPRTFPTASLTPNYGRTNQMWDAGVEDGNKGFAIVSGTNTSRMETSVFGIGAMDQAILTFDQAYNLTPGASISVEISTNGGATYETVLFSKAGPLASGNSASFGSGTPQTRPNNKMVLDLGNYLGQNNLRIRFNYVGARTGDIWAVDAIKVPEGPRGVTIEWKDYTDPSAPILIDTVNTVQYIPKKIGLNIFEVKTALIFDSTGSACPIEENAEDIEVFVFDKYITTAVQTVEGCGNYRAQLGATVTGTTGGDLTANFKTAGYETPDGYKGEWVVTPTTGFTLSNPNANDTRNPKNNPDAILTATAPGDFTVTWSLIPVPVGGKSYTNTGCQPTTPSVTVSFKDCTTLDFDGFNDFADLGEAYTGDYSIEAWIRPFTRTKPDGTNTDASKGTIISTPNLEINMSDLSGLVTPNDRWYHIAVDSDGKLYVDGIASGRTITKTGTSRAFIGARWNAPDVENFFSGWIEEVRIWNDKISEKNIRFTMNQRLKGTGNIGVEVDMIHPDAPVFANLAGYYQLFANDILPGGYTKDLANNAVDAKLRNMETLQENTAPLPYTSNIQVTGQDWETDNTWTHYNVWDPPYSAGINGTKIEWNIVRTSTNIFSNNKDIKVLGLISEVNTLTMEGVNPTGWQSGAGGSGNPLIISHYLKLNGGIDLAGESQLLQPELSIVAPTSSGWLERDQQGTANSFNYNYWSSPVSSAPGNIPYTIKGAMKDGSNQANGIPADLDFGDPYAYADGGLGNPRKISRYWLNLFHGTENVYAEWLRINETTSIPVGEGYTMKGTAGNVGIGHTQNYTYRGIPNNGDVNLSISAGQSYMIGNPYPSAIIADHFIRDNLKDVTNGGNTVNSFNGTLYFWSHFAGGSTHILKEYIGGYAVYNLSGGTKAFANDDRINNQNPNMQGGERPEQVIPVGQSFFVTSVPVNLYDESSPMISIPGGNIKFTNSQRIFQKEEINESVFHKPEIVVKGNKEVKDHTDKRSKFWLKFESPKGYHREILVAADENATDGFDLGYDAPMIEYNIEDMFWLLGSTELVIQGVPDFDKARVIPLGLVVDESKEFTIKIEELKNIPDESTIYLKDKLKDTIHDLRKSAYVSSSEPGYINERFEIVFLKEIPTTEPDPTKPGEEIDYGVELSFRHAHVGRELQILNPKQVPINELILFDMNGKLVTTYRNIAHEKEVRLPVRNFSAGVYIAKLYSEHGVITKKIIIQN